MSIGHANGDRKTAVCILDRESARFGLDTRSGAIKTTTKCTRIPRRYGRR